MKLKLIEISFSKEAKRQVDEVNSASAWVRLGVTVEVQAGDEIVAIVDKLRPQIQEQVDLWLDSQAAYIPVPPETETLPEFTDEADIRAHLAGAVGPEIPINVTSTPINGASRVETDEIPL